MHWTAEEVEAWEEAQHAKSERVDHGFSG